ncbi:hypothetical protein RintRC_4344 [Richelia intracellularis]|nr:hypothetical protein RintRC_4344 [Richelia intracellularis]
MRVLPSIGITCAAAASTIYSTQRLKHRSNTLGATLLVVGSMI